MNELESQHVHEFRIRKSVKILLLKGAFAWLLLAAMDFGFDQIPTLLSGIDGRRFGSLLLNTDGAVTPNPLFHLTMNVLYGWLLLYIVLSWVFEYYIIKHDSIIVRKGIIFSDENAYQMEDIKTIEVFQGFFGKLFNMGTLRLFAFRARQDIVLTGIDRPHRVAAHIHELHPAPQLLEYKPWP